MPPALCWVLPSHCAAFHALLHILVIPEQTPTRKALVCGNPPTVYTVTGA